MSRNVIFQKSRHNLRQTGRNRGFTLVELLAVMGVIALLSTLLLFSIPSISESQNVTKAAYIVAGALEQARSYALANNTYAWVGFFEEDETQSSTSPATTGVGRLVISLVASQDGTRYSDNVLSISLPAAFGAGDASNSVTLAQITPLIRLDHMHMVAVNNDASSGNNPVRPAVATTYQMGEPVGQGPNNVTGLFALHIGATAGNPTTFASPLVGTGGGQTAQYTFAKIIEFNPQGEASKIVENVFSGPGPADKIEIALQPTHSGVISSHYSGSNQNMAAAAIQIEGLSGQIRVYRP